MNDVVTIKFGSKSITLDNEVSVIDILKNESFKAILGFGDSVDVFIDGGIAREYDTAYPGSTVVLSTKAQAKG